MITNNQSFPHFIKYMGSKTEIIDFVIEGINEIHREGQAVCDLFAGSATLAGALRNNNIHYYSNDIQAYSDVLTKVYLNNYNETHLTMFEIFLTEVENRVTQFKQHFEELVGIDNYPDNMSLEEFHLIEERQRNLQNYDGFAQFDTNYIFTKNYSGTYWKFEQCIWIDSIRGIAENYTQDQAFYNAILASLMYAMAYNSQGTGHYAQYRDAAEESSMLDIMIYRKKEIRSYFVKKFESIITGMTHTDVRYETLTLNYLECINNLPEGTLIYADPPYGKVHYSRFYHVLETLVRYDHPILKHKGRYRTDRHQSPFCKTSTVESAFADLFKSVIQNNHDLVLSYSDGASNAINLKNLLKVVINNFAKVKDITAVVDKIAIITEQQLTLEGLAENKKDQDLWLVKELESEQLVINNGYEVKLKKLIHNHSTMGRKDDKKREVKEVLLIINRVD